MTSSRRSTSAGTSTRSAGRPRRASRFWSSRSRSTRRDSRA